jgi:hypothetical protein
MILTALIAGKADLRSIALVRRLAALVPTTSTEQPSLRKLLEKWFCRRALAVVVADNEAGVVFSPIVHGGGKRRAFGITGQPVVALCAVRPSTRKRPARQMPSPDCTTVFVAQRSWRDLLLVRPQWDHPVCTGAKRTKAGPRWFRKGRCVPQRNATLTRSLKIDVTRSALATTAISCVRLPPSNQSRWVAREIARYRKDRINNRYDRLQHSISRHDPGQLSAAGPSALSGRYLCPRGHGL